MIELQVYEIQAKLLLEEMEKKSCQYSFAKTFGIAVRLKPEEVLRELYPFFNANAWRLLAPRPNFIVAIKDEYFVTMMIVHRSKYSSIGVSVWARSQQAYNELYSCFQNLFKTHLAQGPICGMRWAYQTSNGQDSLFLEELIEETVHNEAYPGLVAKWGSVDNFIDKYYESDASILIFQGKPGTGKSRLIRYLLSKFVTKSDQILTEEDERSTYKSSVLYTSDEKLFESDELFARFISSDEKIFIVEDADHILQPRTNGNKNIHRFLTISDGIFRAIGKKVIFTSNLANIGDIDDALRRPGRCFAHETFNHLSDSEAKALAEKLQTNGQWKIDPKKKYTVADVYSEVYK